MSTSGERQPWAMAAQTMTELKRSSSRTQQSAQRSFLLRCMCTMPSPRCKENLDSSEKRTVFQCHWYSNESVHVANQDNFDDDVAVKRTRRKDVVQVNHSTVDDYEQFAQ